MVVAFSLLVVLAVVSLTLAVYPYVIYPSLLKLLKPATPLPLPYGAPEDVNGGRFALLFCVFNELDSIDAKLTNIAQLLHRYPGLEVLVYDDGSTDGTADRIEQAGLRIRLFQGEGRRGKAHGMKRLAAATSREYLVFTDANVTLDLGAIAALQSCYQDPNIGGVCGVLSYIQEQSTATSAAGDSYWGLEERIKQRESLSGSTLGADGSIFSIRARLYPRFPDTVLDDLTVSMSVIFNGLRLVHDPRVQASEPLVASSAKDIRRRIRISTRAFHTHRYLAPQLRAMSVKDRWKYWSHRYVRWNGGILLAVSMLSALSAITLWNPLLACVAAGVGAAGYAAARLTNLGKLSAVAHGVRSIFATQQGVFRAVGGQTMATWQPPR